MTKEGKILIAIIAVIVAVMIGGFILLNKSNQTGNSGTVDTNLLVRSNSNKIGNGTKVTFVEFADFQCPACSTVFTVVDKLISNYKDRVTFVYRYFPLTQIHKNSLTADEAAEAAAAQGKFWEMAKKLYANQQQWENSDTPVDFFAIYAQELGLDVSKFKNDITTNKYSDKITQDQNDGEKIGIQGTPTIYINGKTQSNFDYSSLRDQLNTELAK